MYFRGAPRTKFFYHADGNGNITYLIKPDKTIGASYAYDPYGRTLGTPGGSLAAVNTYQFSSKELMAASGLYYYGYRFYDPVVQRWINRDPIQEVGGINLGDFVYNNPVNYLDGDGLTPVGAGIGAAIGAGIGGIVVGNIGWERVSLWAAWEEHLLSQEAEQLLVA